MMYGCALKCDGTDGNFIQVKTMREFNSPNGGMTISDKSFVFAL